MQKVSLLWINQRIVYIKRHNIKFCTYFRSKYGFPIKKYYTIMMSDVWMSVNDYN